MKKSVIGFIFASIMLWATAPVLKTGQTKSYDQNGNVITDGSIKDDGYYQEGKDRSYSRSAVGVVTDRATRLEWQDDVNAVSKPWVTQANYDAGNYDDTAGDTAETYCSNLALDGGGWRLPSVSELASLISYVTQDPAIPDGIFSHISLSPYWSATTNTDYATSGASVVDFRGGDIGINEKNQALPVRCVRGGSLVDSDFNRVGDTVSDSASGLIWQDDEATASTKRNWTEALQYCEGLVLGGYSDWRLPNVNEMLSIVNAEHWTPSVDFGVFENIAADGYWTSTSYNSNYNTVYAWVVNFIAGNSSYYNSKKDDRYYVRCVRGGSMTPPPSKGGDSYYIIPLSNGKVVTVGL